MEKINILKKICPVCNTDEFVTYIMGSHAEGMPVVINGEKQYISGDCTALEHYECDKCNGNFSVHYNIENGKIKFLKIDYSGDKADKSGFHAWA